MARKIKLDDIVREYIISTGSDSMHMYPVYLQSAIRGLKSCDYDVSGVVRYAKLTLNSTNSATLPDDFVKAIKFGMVDSYGKIIEIYKNDSIMPDPDVEVTTVASSGFLLSANDSPSSVIKNGELIGRRYGNVGGGVYSFAVNESSDTITFSSNVTGDVYAIYIGDPKKVNGSYLIHPFLVEPIMRFIYYSAIRFNKYIPRGEKDAAYRDFLNAKHHANVQFYSESVGSIINASRKTFSQAPKY